MRFILNVLTLAFGLSLTGGVPALGQSIPYGAWKNPETGIRIDILDGFSPGFGPALITEENGEIVSSEWRLENGEISLRYQYSSVTLEMRVEGRLFQTEAFGKDIELVGITKEAPEGDTVTLRQSQDAFIHRLQATRWATGTNEKYAEFQSTFSPETGVMAFSDGDSARPWSVSSGILKIGGDVIVEARITPLYFIGLDDDDDFVVFPVSGRSAARVSEDIQAERDEFFDALLTGSWVSKDYSGETTHRFRPITGELAGLILTTRDGKLQSESAWEYSPATGALSIGYTSYVNAIVVNDTLALLDGSGDQKFYSRKNLGGNKRYSLADTTSISFNENTLDQIQKALSPQFQRGEYLYAFEFNENGRTGFVHQWRSSPFTITGETFSSDLVANSKDLHRVEDIITFSGETAFRIDTTPSRLRVKSEDEVKNDAKALEERREDAMSRNLILRITKTNGHIVNLAIPISDFAQIADMAIVLE